MMDITCYLPDDIGRSAKAYGLPFSRLLRKAVEDELALRRAFHDHLDRLFAPPSTFDGEPLP